MTRSMPTATPPTGDLAEPVVYMVDESHCKITPPSDTDSEVVKQMKLFLLACMHRRNLDPDFETDMRLWLGSYDPEEFRKAVESNSHPINRH